MGAEDIVVVFEKQITYRVEMVVPVRSNHFMPKLLEKDPYMYDQPGFLQVTFSISKGTYRLILVWLFDLHKQALLSTCSP